MFLVENGSLVVQLSVILVTELDRTINP